MQSLVTAAGSSLKKKLAFVWSVTNLLRFDFTKIVNYTEKLVQLT